MLQATTLESSERWVQCVISLPEFVVAAADDGSIRVYDRETSGTVRVIFQGHECSACDLAYSDDNLVVSVDWDGQIFTWRPSNTEAIGFRKADDGYMWRAVAVLDNSRLLASTDRGNLTLLSHSSRRNLKTEEKIIVVQKSSIWPISISEHLVVSCSRDKNAKVWNKKTLNEVATLRLKNLLTMPLLVTDILCWLAKMAVSTFIVMNRYIDLTKF